MKKDVYIISASDRYNYGDILFPIITKNELSKHARFNFTNIAIVNSDLSSVGAMPTKSYRTIYEDNSKGTLLFAGGEVLGANWTRIISFIYPWFFFLYQRIDNKQGLEKIVRLLLGYKNNPIPFIPTDPYIVNKFNIVYHGVGGNSISRSNSKLSICKTFHSTISFSVRDKGTFNEIRNYYDIDNVKLIPDPAMLMSDYFSFPNATGEKYIAFQVGHYKNGGDLGVINNELKKLYKYSGLSVYFIPVGNCPGHDDAKSLLWLYKNAEYPCKYIQPHSIETIMKTIAKSRLFIGTSLHGIITAMSFNTPFLAINPNIEKLKNYIETWSYSSFDQMCEFNKIAESSLIRIKNTYCFNDNINMQKELVRKSFENIAKLIS